MMNSGMDSGLVKAAGYGPPGGPPGGYGPPGGGPPGYPPGGGGGGYGPPGGGPPGGYGPPGGGPPGYGPPPGGPPGYGQPPGGPPGYGPPPGGGFGPPPGGFGPPGGPMMMGGPRFNPLALTSMILGILSIPMCCCQALSVPLAIAGLVLGIIGLTKIRANPQGWKGGGMAIAGIATSSVGIILSLIGLLTTIDENLRHQYYGG
jgi:hypothetical protein